MAIILRKRDLVINTLCIELALILADCVITFADSVIKYMSYYLCGEVSRNIVSSFHLALHEQLAD